MIIFNRIKSAFVIFSSRSRVLSAALILWIIWTVYLIIILFKEDRTNKDSLLHQPILYKSPLTTEQSQENTKRIHRRRRPIILSPEENKILRRYQPFKAFFNENELSMVYDLLEKFDVAMKKYEIFYVMCGGTLLGSYRFHDIIPWDDDIDVFVHINDSQRLKEALLTDYPSQYTYGYYNHGKFYRNDGFQLTRYPWKFPYVDIIYFYDTELTVKETVKAYGKRLTFSKEFLYPSHPRPLGPLILAAPKDTLRFLIQSFGASENCTSTTYSHALELPLPPPSYYIDCRSLGSHYPFVHRKALPLSESEVGVEETLVSSNRKVLNQIVVNEPAEAINEAYAIKISENEEQRIKKHFKNLHEMERDKMRLQDEDHDE